MGLQPNRPAATSTNNEDFFPSPQSSVAKDSSSPQEKALPNSEPSRSSVRSMSLRGSSERRSQSQSSAIRRVRRCNVQNGSVISNESPSLNLIPEPGCFDIKTPRSRDVDRSLEGPSGASEPKVIAVERDGQTYWIPESILKQFSATKSRDLLAQAQNEDGCVGKPTKPSDMRISIPKRAGSSQLRCSSESSSLDLTNGSSPPSSVPSSAFSSSTCSRETPRTSLEPLTPTEAPFSHCLPSPDHWLTANPATSRLIQEDTPEAAPKDARSIYFPPPLQPRNPARIHASTPGRSTMSSTEQLRENEHRVESSSLLDNSRNDMNLHSCSVGAQDLPKQSRGRQWARRLSFGGKSRRRSYGQLSKEVYLQKDLPAIPNLEKKDSSLNFKSATIGQEPKHHSGIGNDQPQDGLISSNAAEAVILGILNSTESLEDLFAAARVNRGFYSLFDRNKLALFKCALYNGSRPTWEFMEIESQKTRTALHRSGICSTANTYLQTVKQHNCILTALKGMVFEQCHSWLRSETVKGLTGLKISKSADVDKALWRIWTFCTLFGPKTGRDNDMAGQLDWLRGGQVASRTLQNIPRSFAQSNFGGLTLDELFDMLEMWSCIQTLLSSMQGIHMRYTARQYGIFDGHDIKEGDESQEQFVLGRHHPLIFFPNNANELTLLKTNGSTTSAPKGSQRCSTLRTPYKQASHLHSCSPQAWAGPPGSSRRLLTPAPARASSKTPSPTSMRSKSPSSKSRNRMYPQKEPKPAANTNGALPWSLRRPSSPWTPTACPLAKSGP